MLRRDGGGTHAAVGHGTVAGHEAGQAAARSMHGVGKSSSSFANQVLILLPLKCKDDFSRFVQHDYSTNRI